MSLAGVMPDGGCINDEPMEWVEGHSTRECPVMFYDPLSLVIEGSEHLERNVLPVSGGWLDQPAALMRAIRLFSRGNE